MIRRDCGKTGDALSAGGKSVAEFARHGDHVTVSSAELSAEDVEGRLQAVQSKPERRRRLPHRFDATVLYARRFQMRAPNIPPDDDAHRSSQISKATLDPSEMEGEASRHRQQVASTSKMNVSGEGTVKRQGGHH